MTTSKSSRFYFRKGNDLAIHPFATSVLKNTLPSRKAIRIIRSIARVSAGLEPMLGDLKSPTDTHEKLPLEEDIEEETYHQNISKYLLALINDINRLEAIQTYLSFTNFLSKKLDDGRISVQEWLQYHYSNHVLTTISIYDTSLCLFNSTAQLNIKQNPRFEKDIRSKIKGNEEYESIKLSLDNIKNKVSQHREPRNSFIHRGENPNHDELLRISIVDFYNLWSRYSDGNYKSNSRKRTAEANRLAINGLRNELEEETENICNLILALFSALQPIYEKNL